MTISKKQKTTLILIGAAVAAYFLYRWYTNRQQSNTSNTGLGSNLNSVAPALVAGSTGPSSGLNYYAGDTTVYGGTPVSAPSSGGQGSAQSGANGSAGTGTGSGTGINSTGGGAVNPGGTMLPTPVYNNGTFLTTVQQLQAALAAAGNPNAPVATNADLKGTTAYKPPVNTTKLPKGAK